MPKRTDIESILVIGSGPIIIGQACEFDYSGTQAVKALRQEGYRVILVNSNPATIMTDPEVAPDAYIEPLVPEVLEKIIAAERPDAMLADGWWTNRAQPRCCAGRTVAMLERYGVTMIGATRERRRALPKIDSSSARRCKDEGLPVPRGRICPQC